MVSERVKSSVPCVFIAISCAAIAVSALVIYDVVKIGKSTTDNTGALRRTTTQAPAITTKTSITLRAGPGGRTAVPGSTRQTVREQRVTHTKLSKGTVSTNNERHNASSTRTGERRDASTDAKNGTKGTHQTTRLPSSLKETTAAKATIPKRPELPLPTTNGTDREMKKADSNVAADGGATGSNALRNSAASSPAKRAMKPTDVTATSETPEKRTTDGRSQEASDHNNRKTKAGNAAAVPASETKGNVVHGRYDLQPSPFPDVAIETTTTGRYEEGANGSSTTALNDTQAPFFPNEPSANAVPRGSVESVTHGVSQTAKGEAFETAADDSGYGATGDPRREGRMGGGERVANRLLCTAGSRAYSEEMLPTDGICDLMFYTDVIWQDGTIRGAQNQESWQAFQAAAQTATRTGHGMSVDYGKANDFFGSLTAPLGRQTLRELFFKKIVHYGILKAAGTVAQLLDDMHGKLNLLKALKQLQEKFASEVSGTRPRLDLVLGVRFSSYGSPNDSKQHSAAMTALSNHFPITVFVIHTHVEDWETGRYPLIGTLWDYGQDGANAVKTPSLLHTAKDLNAASVPPRMCVMASFTMMVGEFHKVKMSTKNVLSAGALVLKDFAQVCTRKGGAAVVNKGLVKLYSAGYNRTYAYDDAETMTAKAAAFFKLYQHMCRGWAVFDTEFEDYDDTCGNGTFSRLKIFKAKLGA